MPLRLNNLNDECNMKYENCPKNMLRINVGLTHTSVFSFVCISPVLVVYKTKRA